MLRTFQSFNNENRKWLIQSHLNDRLLSSLQNSSKVHKNYYYENGQNRQQNMKVWAIQRCTNFHNFAQYIWYTNKKLSVTDVQYWHNVCMSELPRYVCMSRNELRICIRTFSLCCACTNECVPLTTGFAYFAKAVTHCNYTQIADICVYPVNFSEEIFRRWLFHGICVHQNYFFIMVARSNVLLRFTEFELFMVVPLWNGLTICVTTRSYVTREVRESIPVQP